MLVFDVRSLAVNAARVDGALAPDDAIWMPEDAKPDGPVLVTGRLSAAGQRRFYFSGRIEGSATLDCRRCLTPVAVGVAESATAIFTEEENEDAGDPDVFDLAQGGRVVDLRPAIREQWLLNAPSFAVCRADCRGFCPTCGADWNAGTCEHDSAGTASDSRSDAARTKRARVN